MADTLSILAGPAQAASGTSTIFTVPSAHTYTVKYISLINMAHTPTTVELGINGVGNSNIFFPLVELYPYGAIAEYSGLLVFPATYTMQIQVSQASAITYTVHGIDQG